MVYIKFLVRHNKLFLFKVSNRHFVYWRLKRTSPHILKCFKILSWKSSIKQMRVKKIDRHNRRKIKIPYSSYGSHYSIHGSYTSLPCKPTNKKAFIRNLDVKFLAISKSIKNKRKYFER